VSRVVEAEGSMFEVQFDGSNVIITPRFRPGCLQIPVGAITAVTIRMPKTLASGGIQFTVPSDPAVDGVRVEFFRSQAGDFFDLHAALMQAIGANAGSINMDAMSHTGDDGVIVCLRQTGALSGVEFGVRRSELLAGI
jgi:hypothetical protein